MSRFLLHESVKESVVRLYEKKDAETGEEAYAKRLPYVAEYTVDYLTHDIVYVSGFLSRVKMTRAEFQLFKEYAKAKGIKEIWQERNGIIEVEHL